MWVGVDVCCGDRFHGCAFFGTSFDAWIPVPVWVETFAAIAFGECDVLAAMDFKCKYVLCVGLACELACPVGSYQVGHPLYRSRPNTPWSGHALSLLVA